MSNKPIMYLMSGPSGAGKTTFAKKFAEENNLQYLGIDDFYKMFNGNENRHCDEFEVWISFFSAIHLAEKAKRDIVVDTNSPTITKRTEFLDWFPSFEHHLIFIWATEKLCRKNNRARNRVIPNKDFREIYDSIQIPVKDWEDDRWESITCYQNLDNSNLIPRFPTLLRYHGADIAIIPDEKGGILNA